MPIPYHKNKQEAFRAAEQAVFEARQAVENIVKHEPSEGTLTKRAWQEINEAEVQMNKALTVATEKQHKQLAQYEEEIMELKSNLPPE